MPTPVEVFLSYSHKDERLLQKLRNHLAPLEQRGFVAAWHDRRIMPGEDWERAISAQLGQCRIILLLISDNFIASDYCNGVEVKTALERHATGEARVIPIVLSDVAWEETELGRLQALPTNAKPVTRWKDRNQAWRDVVRGIEAAVKQTTAPATASEQNSTAGRTREVGRGFFLNHISFLRPEKQQEFRERTGVQLDHYDIRVVVDAEHPELLDSIERIEYTLDPAYPEDVRVRTARDRRTKFLLKEIANGEYVLRAKVFIRGEPKAIELERYLTLWRSGPELP